jgi:hypothetical protein
MTMEKYSVDDQTLLLNLQNEEGQLMTRVSQILCDPFHSDGAELATAESRLKDLRYRIDELRLKKIKAEEG